ncbi:MAG: hypothetical protein ACRC1K_02570, partial [Planctomycetia bacterium]
KTRIMQDLTARPPALIFIGEKPFGALAAFLEENYVTETPPFQLEHLQGRGLYLHRPWAANIPREQWPR